MILFPFAAGHLFPYSCLKICATQLQAELCVVSYYARYAVIRSCPMYVRMNGLYGA